MSTFASISTLAGLGLTALGAGITAWAVMLGAKEADMLATTRWDMNRELRDALLKQSRAARTGLAIVVFGTLLQMAGFAAQL